MFEPEPTPEPAQASLEDPAEEVEQEQAADGAASDDALDVPDASPAPDLQAEVKLRLYPKVLTLAPGETTRISAWSCPADDRSPFGPDREPGTADDDCDDVQATWSVEDEGVAALSHEWAKATRVTLLAGADTKVIARRGELKQGAPVMAQD